MLRAAQVPEATVDHRSSSRPGGLNLAQGIALYVGAVLGTGVLALPGLASGQAGPASLVAWSALVLMSVPLASTFAVLASRYPDAGGVSTYARLAFGDRASTIVGWWFYLGAPVGIPALAFFGSAYLERSTGGGWAATAGYAGALLLFGFGANAFGVRVSGKIQLVLSAGLAILLVLAVVVALPKAHVATLHPFAPHGWSAVVSVGALLVWAFTGWETVTHLSAEFAHPQRDVKRATAGALLAIGVLYLSLAAVTVLALGAQAGSESGGSSTSLASLLQLGLGGAGPTIASVVAVLTTLGTMNAYIASTAKLGAALARDGSLPGRLGKGVEAGGVPRRSLAVVATVSGGVFVVTAVTRLSVEPLVLSTTACFASVYAVGAAAGIRLLRHKSRSGLVSAVAALGVVVILLCLTGRYVGWPIVLAFAALGWCARRTSALRSR